MDVVRRYVGIPPVLIGTRLATALPSRIDVGGGFSPLSFTTSLHQPSGTRCCSSRRSSSNAFQRTAENRERGPALQSARAVATGLSESTSPR